MLLRLLARARTCMTAPLEQAFGNYMYDVFINRGIQ